MVNLVIASNICTRTHLPVTGKKSVCYGNLWFSFIVFYQHCKRIIYFWLFETKMLNQRMQLLKGEIDIGGGY